MRPARFLGWGTYGVIETSGLPHEKVMRLLLRERLTRNGRRTHAQSSMLAGIAVTIAIHLSDRKLAAMVGLSHPTIAAARRKLSTLERGELGMVDTQARGSVSARRETVDMRNGRNRSTAYRPKIRSAVYASTPEDADPHFIGWREDVNVDELFQAGRIYGITVRRTAQAAQVVDLESARRRKRTIELAAA